MKDLVRTGWHEAPIGELFKTVTGNTPPKSRKELYGTDVPLVKPPELEDGPVEEASDGLSIEGASVARVAPSGSVLVSCIGILGKVGLAKTSVAFNQQINAIYPDETKALPEFMFYQVLSPQFKAQIEALATGTTVSIVNKSRFNSIRVSLPPLEEQRRIVAVLDEAFEGLTRARGHAETNLENSRELFEAIKSAILTEARSEGSPVTLDDVTTIASSLVDPREDAYADLPHLGAGNMITGSDELIDVKTAREERLISGKYIFEEGTVLYSKIRPYLRKAARPDFEGLCSADVYPLTPEQKRLDRDFLFHLLLADDFTQYAIQGSDRAGMPKVNRRHLFAYEFHLPPLGVQRHAAAKIDEAKRNCDLLVSAAARKLDDLEELRQSVLQKAFAGQLT